MRQEGAEVVNIDVIFFGNKFLDRFQRRLGAIDIIGTCALSIPVLTPTIPINDSLQDVDGSIGLMGGQFNLNDGLIFLVLDEEAGIVGTAKKGRLTAQAEADGAENCGFACTIGTYDDIESNSLTSGSVSNMHQCRGRCILAEKSVHLQKSQSQ